MRAMTLDKLRGKLELRDVDAGLPGAGQVAGRVLAEGTPYDVITPEVLRQTYGADMPVIHYEGMPIVAESPHRYARADGANGDEARAGHSHSHA